MLIDARGVPEGTVIKADVCVIGGGAAGITLAREFIGQPFRVCLLESGGLEFDDQTQSLYAGENIGQPYFNLDLTRLRYFGGSTNHWGGFCKPLDDIDFETRDWVPDSGWPFTKAHLAPFYERAQSICQLGPFVYDPDDLPTKTCSCLPLGGSQVVTKLYQFSRPTNFGKVYLDGIAVADNVHAYLYGNLEDVETLDTTQNVTRVSVTSLGRKTFFVYAKLFILATGGIENPRLLLLSNKKQRAGLGNQHDLVGRYFMEHPHLESGSFVLSNPKVPLGFYKKHYQVVNGARVSVQGFLAISPEAMRRDKLLSFSATLIPSYSDPDGISSPSLPSESIRQGGVPDEFSRHLGNVICDMDDVAIPAYGKLFKQNQAFPMISVSLYNRTEQAPNRESRVILGDEVDALGKNRVRLDWRLSPGDKQSLRRAQELIGQELGRAGLGRMRVTLDDDNNTWPLSLIGGNHHMGTTRMHDDPKRGVVNKDCQVHGISNLFIAGSSVFPTSGSANPTLTIIALTLRLADHVKRLMT